MKQFLIAGTSLMALLIGTSAFAAEAPPSTKSSPLDTHIYRRDATPEDSGVNKGTWGDEDRAGPNPTEEGQLSVQLLNPPVQLRQHPIKIRVVDTILNNSSPVLGTGPGSEVGIAVDPKNNNKIVVTAFEFNLGWGTGPASVFISKNGGTAWTEPRTINPPPGETVTGLDSCPCDQTLDFNRSGGLLNGAFLTADGNIFTGTTAAPATGPYFFNTPTNSKPDADQPWMLVNNAPLEELLPIEMASFGAPEVRGELVYTAYDDFSANPVATRVAVAHEAVGPLNFNIDSQTGSTIGPINPGHRLAKDLQSGAMYSLFQRAPSQGQGGSVHVEYLLNRSTDGGQTWSLNGSDVGDIIASEDSDQSPGFSGKFKFCTVNALLGGVDHAAVAPNGSVYYVYGHRDFTTGANRIAIRHLTDDNNGGLTIGPEQFVTGQVQAAIPQVAVNKDGIVGVFFYTCDTPNGPGGFPQFTAHFAVSDDGGTTFANNKLLTFLSPAKDNGDSRQRVLGDYMQMKTIGGRNFFGSFAGNGAAVGGKVSEIHPFFFRVLFQ